MYGTGKRTLKKSCGRWVGFLDADGSPPLPDRTSRMRVDHLRPNESKTKNEMLRSGLSNISGMSAQTPSQNLDSGLRVKDESLMLGQTSEFSNHYSDQNSVSNPVLSSLGSVERESVDSRDESEILRGERRTQTKVENLHIFSMYAKAHIHAA